MNWIYLVNIYTVYLNILKINRCEDKDFVNPKINIKLFILNVI